MEAKTPEARSLRAGFFVDAQVRARDIISRSAAGHRQRFVWFVAISGYVFVNGPTFWSILLRHQISDLELISLAAPWIVTAIASSLAILEADRHDDEHQMLYLERIEASNQYRFCERFEKDDESLEWNAIVRDEVGGLPSRKKDTERREARKTLISQAVNGLVIFSFLWAFVGPLLIR